MDKDIDWEAGPSILIILQDADGKELWKSLAEDLWYQPTPGAGPVCVQQRLEALIPEEFLR